MLEKVFDGVPDVFCYYEPLIGAKRPDFVLFGKDFGVVTIEVKDYREEDLFKVPPNGAWVLQQGHRQVPVQNPYEQSYQYWRAMASMLNFKTIQRIVAFSNVSITGHAAELIQARKPSKISIFFKEHLLSRATFSTRFQGLISHDAGLSNEQLDFIRGNFMPACRVPRKDGSHLKQATLIPPDKLVLLDKKQEEMAYNLGDGHRLFFGVAGSGKTVILVARARYLAKRHPSWRILVLCFNKVLSKYLEAKINPQDLDADVFVFNFHKWAKNIIERAGTKYMARYNVEFEQCKINRSKNEFFNEIVPRLVSEAIQNTDIPCYDAILIDEGQDFEDTWFKCIMQVLNPDTNSLLVTCDGLQGIYARNRFTWKSVGIQAVGRTKKLRKSYRNPYEIGIVAKNILPKNIKDLIGKSDEFVATEGFLRDGGICELTVLPTKREERVHVLSRVKEVRDANLNAVVLFKKALRNHGEIPLIRQIKQAGIPWVDIRQWGMFEGLMIGTVHATKGIEEDVIIIPEIDLYTTQEDLQLLYVGMTRAIHRLYLSATSRPPIVKRIENILAR
ncbi:AAA family ATPase [Candidatus Bathyarchaeota archaeon]|nr:AAA family ATPase [Candidatus Bathyarchaeota archaeon]